MVNRIFTLILTLILCHSGLALPSASRSGKGTHGRKPASASCAGAECDCLALKDLVARCPSGKWNSDDKSAREIFFAISSLTKDAKTGHLRSDLRSCSQISAAESCRSRLKRLIGNYRSRQSPYKVSASRGLSNFSLDLMDSASSQPRSPASAK